MALISNNGQSNLNMIAIINSLIFSYIQPNKKLPFKDNTFDIIIVSMVLHHIKNTDFVISELYRILKKGGILLIREHDAYDINDKMLIEIQHIIYMYKTYNKKYIKMNKEYYSNYKSIKEWIDALKNRNFFIEYDKKIMVKTMRQFIILSTK